MLMQIIGSGGSFDDLGVVIYTLVIGNLVAPWACSLVTGVFCGILIPRLGIERGTIIGALVGFVTTGGSWLSTFISAWATDGDINVVGIVLGLVAVCGCVVTVLLCHRRSRKVPESGEG